MLISDVLRTKGHHVVKIHPTDSVELAARKLAEHRIGALVVEDRWMKPVGIFSERDFINAIAREGAAVLGFDVSTTDVDADPQLSLRRSRGCHACENDNSAGPSLAGDRGEQLKGIVSIGDLVKHRLDAKELEARVLLDLSRMRP